MYRSGLLVGKYCPLHIGHGYAIRTALEHCEKLTILSYAYPDYHYDKDLRTYWFECLKKELNLENKELTVIFLDKNDKIPHNDDPDILHRNFCAKYLLEVLEITVDCVFSSEQYGYGFAEYLENYFNSNLKIKHKVDHFCIDLERKKYSVSATLIRNRTLCKSKYTLDFVSRTLVKKILILGGESSGKTTLAEKLAQVLKCSWVPEYGREYFESLQGNLRYEDFDHIARTQIDLERITPKPTDNYLVCDTSTLTTFWYSRETAGRASRYLESTLERHYDYIYICDPNIDFVQDGTRIDSEFRQRCHDFYLNFLNTRGIKYHIVDGPVEKRINQVMKTLY